MRRQGLNALAWGAAAATLAGCGPWGGQPHVERACGEAVLTDWADGRIDRTYPEPCYEAAIDVMPEDLRAYTTAKDDIARALYSHRDDPR
jgi:hypothetical protein